MSCDCAATTGGARQQTLARRDHGCLFWVTIEQQCGGVLLVRGTQLPSGIARLVIHVIKEVEGKRQQEAEEDKRDEEIGDEVNGEVEEVTQRTHETWR